MSKPIIGSGKFHAGADFQCGENVIINVAEEMVVGDRVVLPDNAYFEGRSILIGSDFYGYSWGHPSGFVVNRSSHNVGGDLVPTGSWLEVGRGRIDAENARLTVGDRCTFHNNRIDLAKPVVIGNDVGLSPEVIIYNHGYWLSPLKGYPCTYGRVDIGKGSVIGFRSVILPFACLGPNVVIGAQSVVTGRYYEGKSVYAGNPAKLIGPVQEMPLDAKMQWLEQTLDSYHQSCRYRGWAGEKPEVRYPKIRYGGCSLDVEELAVVGEENEATDDFREFLFKRGLRFYTKRPFKRLGRKV